MIVTSQFPAHKGWLLAGLLLISIFAHAQLPSVSGTVTSSSERKPVPGVTVRIKGDAGGTTTDTNGKFTLQNVPSNAVLLFSAVGFTAQEKPVSGQTNISISLQDNQAGLNEVVVVGYGTQRKTDLTGSVTSLRAEKLQEMPVVSIEQAVQGRMAGVQVQQTSGQPGAGISIRVRGVSSIAGGNEPLYVIDGLPQFNDDVRGANGLATINPSDIESIEVLKDAAATAIYGSRGANGVVMVTTKSGKAGPPRITFETSLGFQQVRKKLDLMNSTEYVDFAKRYYANSNLPVPADLANLTPAINTDWQDEVFHTGIQSNSSLSISGGTERSRYFVSGGIISQAPLIRDWDSTDLRKKFSLYNSYVINGAVVKAEIEPGIYDMRMGKYKDPNAPIDTGNGNDFYCWRFADVLLIFAEAENKLNGPTAAAFDAINQVRRRAFGVSTTLPGIVADLPAVQTQTSFDDLVFRERGYEFIGEDKRWFDMVRTGRVAQMISGVAAVIPSPNRKPVPSKFLFALPDVELQNNPLIQ